MKRKMITVVVDLNDEHMDSDKGSTWQSLVSQIENETLALMKVIIESSLSLLPRSRELVCASTNHKNMKLSLYKPVIAMGRDEEDRIDVEDYERDDEGNLRMKVK